MQPCGHLLLKGAKSKSCCAILSVKDVSWVSRSNAFVVHLHFRKPSCSLLNNSKCSENPYSLCVIILKHTKMYLSDYVAHSLHKSTCLSFYQPIKGVISKREFQHALSLCFHNLHVNILNILANTQTMFCSKCEYDQEIQQSHTTDQPMEPRGRATQHSQHNTSTRQQKQSN